PHLFVSPVQSDPERVRAALSSALDASLDAMEQMRNTEGAHLAADLGARLDAVRALVREIEECAPGLADRYRRRLRERITRLLDGLEASLDAGRLEQEVAL